MFETHISITPDGVRIWTNQPSHVRILRSVTGAEFTGENSWDIAKESLRSIDKLFTPKSRGKGRLISDSERLAMSTRAKQNLRPRTNVQSGPLNPVD